MCLGRNGRKGADDVLCCSEKERERRELELGFKNLWPRGQLIDSDLLCLVKEEREPFSADDTGAGREEREEKCLTQM